MTPDLLPERMAAKIRVNEATGCWEWTASGNGVGYGQWHDGTRLRYAHRLAWEYLVGPIPEGLQIDHVCRNRCCCFPGHLEPVTPRENVRRATAKTVCLRGHERNEQNSYYDKNGAFKVCRPCNAERQRIARQARKARAAS